MPQPRKSQISLIDTPFYHCVSRCVRRSFLCGKDKYSGQNYEHRRGWVEDRLLFLSTVFAIDICAYAVLACMAYVDLNPVRANMETTPETSKHTSIKKRTQAVKNKQQQPKTLMPFVGNPRQNMPKGIAYQLKDYCELVDITGRCIREDKAGYIEDHQSPILERLGLDSQQWLTLTTEFEKHFCYAAGAELMMNTFKRHTEHQRLRGMGKAKVLLKRA
jgi:hypothetical protein